MPKVVMLATAVTAKITPGAMITAPWIIAEVLYSTIVEPMALVDIVDCVRIEYPERKSRVAPATPRTNPTDVALFKTLGATTLRGYKTYARVTWTSDSWSSHSSL
jgi:hypothetical protein